jgi:anthranilate synthase component 2
MGTTRRRTRRSRGSPALPSPSALNSRRNNGISVAMLILIDNYDSFTYNLVHYLGELGARCVVHRNDQIAAEEVLKAKPQAIVLSPGPCTPNEAGICLDLIGKAAAAKVPLLGVCLGHQSIGQVFGGKVIRAPEPVHGKLSTIRHFGKGLFKGLPERFEVTRYHSLIVERASLPSVLEVTAETDDKLIMGLQHKTLPIHGVQFHPESIATENGHALLANFLELAGMTPKRVPGRGQKSAA